MVEMKEDNIKIDKKYVSVVCGDDNQAISSKGRPIIFHANVV